MYKPLSVTWVASKGCERQSMTRLAWKPLDPHQTVDGGYIQFPNPFCQTYFAKYFSKSRFDLFAPVSVSTTDFAFVAGSEM